MIGAPFVVLAELQGLVQDSTRSTEHAIKVKEIAAMVVDFIQQKFRQSATQSSRPSPIASVPDLFVMGDKVREF
ncbi:unnamed protein product [Clavelina lepadiformis]|uniref:Uncharacterized protein n=1 Tax=Clavelina lepadiformis TaxID=159417 RepID=A0ABP0F3G3_CLALP